MNRFVIETIVGNEQPQPGVYCVEYTSAYDLRYLISQKLKEYLEERQNVIATGEKTGSRRSTQEWFHKTIDINGTEVRLAFLIRRWKVYMLDDWFSLRKKDPYL